MADSKKIGNNPFEKLDINNFPKEIKKNTFLTYRKGKNKKVPESEDERLFLEAIGELDSSPSKKTMEKPHSLTEQMEDNSFAVAFSAMEKSLSKSKNPEKTQSATDPSALQQNMTDNIPSNKTIQEAKDKFTPAEFKEKAFVNDEDMFLNAIEGAAPLGGHGRIIAPPAIVVNKEENRNPLQDLLDGKLEFAIESTGEYAEGHIVGLDLNVVSQLQAGHFSPEAHIDLHGLNSDQACQNLVAFIRSSYLKGLRMVIVVTGRGNNSFNGIPILKRRVQEWLTQHPLKRVILAYCTARQEDGGIGAFYVLLRKRKKSYGKIQWDLIPTDLETL